ncbi:hypothetical protein KPG71_04670 [Roseovarius sp. PS-C2]|uniref:hypothetical protein n=1 Tax=Roseovarius sp. PS-C2 TaxID=2820814 RepID=UPI001C0E8171|nr:hypothetical protein [Roseovarius sp. PS-C2]MBU3259303.1 hypothetical protein [Roseovarius sp. PS-C2]
MAKVVGDIAVEVSADIGPLQRELNKGTRSVKGFGSNAEKVAKRVAKAGAAIAGGMAVAGAGAYTMVRGAADAGAEIERLSRIANASPEKFQKMAAAAKTVGIGQEKLADILKDVQDRVGDFLQTGGGPMKDFFDNIAPKVGVTAEQFRNLSGPQALQLFVSSLEKANLSQDEMTFYMEAMASDLTALQPLLADNGKEMKRLGDEAQRAGAIMSDEAVKGAQDLQAELDNMTGAISTQFTQAILENKDEIKKLTDDITNVWIPALLSAAGAITKIVDAITDAIQGYNILAGLIKGEDRREADVGTTDQLRAQNELGKGATDSITGRLGGTIGGALSGGGGSDGPLFPSLGDGFEGGSKLDFLQSENEQEFEIQAEHFERMRELLAEYSEGKFELLSEAYARERDLQQQHNDNVMAGEENLAKTKLRIASSVFGDLASLMQSENKKMFQIGKAAAVAKATVSGIAAAIEAYEWGTERGGPAFGAISAAASIAKTATMISQLQSQSYGGGASAGMAGGYGGIGGGQQAAPMNTQYLHFNFTGDGAIPQSAMRDFIAQFNEAIDDGAVIKGITTN